MINIKTVINNVYFLLICVFQMSKALQSDYSSKNSRLLKGIKRKSQSIEINHEQAMKKPKLIKQTELEQEVN